ncbi:MAG TPA: protein translocase subunit SecD [Patescibacteria group bacterium]|jgi:preprotein translocase subunit SecD
MATSIKRIRFAFAGILLLAVLIGLAVWPSGPDLKLFGLDKQLKIHEGLDLEGGSHLVYQADMSKVPKNERTERLDGVVDVIDRRVNALGVSEPLVQANQSAGKYRVIVELPGVTDVEQASKIIGATVNMEFLEQDPKAKPDPTNPFSGYKRQTELTGADFKRANVGFNPQTGEPEINITFDTAGTKEFAEMTRRSVGKPIAIVLDGAIISAPRVSQEIGDGNAVITGAFQVEEAKDLALQLNAGALPVPVEQVEQRTVGPTLGQDSVQKSLAAGLVGLILVAAFMILYYRLPGVLAVLALLLYTGIMIALFKLVPVTLTLAGIAGFILSIGIAVDANILIFERMREELRDGRSLPTALEVGFSRAFTSIRDSNAASLLMSAVLYAFGSGTIRGFAIVLALGVAVSLFSAITVTRTLMRLTVRTRLAERPRLWDAPKGGKRA